MTFVRISWVLLYLNDKERMITSGRQNEVEYGESPLKIKWQYRQCTLDHNIEACSRNHCCSGKAISITHSAFLFVALVFQHAVRVCAALSSVACPASQYFSTLSYKRDDFRRTLLKIKCVFLVSVKPPPPFFSETFLILRRIQQDMIKNVYWLSCKMSVIFVIF